jgi:cyanophycin synthetase
MNGERVGLTTTDGIYIDGQLYLKGDMTGPWSARMVLKDPTVDAAVLETARGGILREGIGFDRCDVGAVLNISNDHLGLYGIDTVEQLAEVKSLVVEIVRDDGTSVLNADDPLVVGMAQRAKGRIVYWSMYGDQESNAVLKTHIEQDGTAVVLQPGMHGEMIAIYDAGQYIPLLWTHLIPATLEGRARHNVANALAATAIAYARGVSIENIKQGLRTFSPTFYQSPGRLNVFDEHPFRVIVDYGHNPAAFAAMREMLQSMRPNHNRLIGVVGAPGDRRDEDICQAGTTMAGMFDCMIVKEDDDLRGRAAGEVAGMLQESAQAAGMPAERITTILNEQEAVRYALDQGQPKDLIVIFADNVTAVWKEVIYYGKPEAQNL